MACELCSRRGMPALVPASLQKTSVYGYLCAMCAGKNPGACLLHRRTHQRYSDGTSVCPACLAGIVREYAREAFVWWGKIARRLPPAELRTLMRYVDLRAAMTGAREETTVLWCIVAKAMRTRRTVEQMVEQILVTGTAECLF